MKHNPYDKHLEIVRAGYDKLAGLYTTEREKFDNWREVDAFVSELPDKAKVLDAGSGTGLPVAQHLVKAGFEVVGIDISEQMVRTAQENVPEADFRQMSMADVDFPRGSFDGVISCYAIIHNPRETHADIFRSFQKILKPGGVMLASVASWAWEEVADYMGVDMFWSHFDPDVTKSLIRAAGFDIEFGRDVEAGGEKHHWVLARKGN